MSEKIPFNVFIDEIWTGELNYSTVCAASCDDNIVPSRPETPNTKGYFCRVCNCQRSTPLFCLCMHKEHQRLVSDPQMDDLNVTLARPQRQSGKEALRIDRGGSFLGCHPQLLCLSFPLCISLSVFLSWHCLSDSLISRSYSHSPPPASHSFYRALSLILSLSFPSLPLSWSPLIEERPILLSLLMSNGKQVRSHWYVDAKNKTRG